MATTRDPLLSRGSGTAGARAGAAAGYPGGAQAGAQTGDPSAALEFCRVGKVFPGVAAVDDVSLGLRYGEIHCLLGENGAGKTSLLNIAAGIYRPDAGRVMVDGRDVAILSPRRARDLGVATVRQHPALVRSLTVVENMMLGQRRGVRSERRRAAAALRAAAARLGVELDPGARVESLSIARRQQVEIARALWWDSRIVLLDEPTSSLAPSEAEELGRVLRSLCDEGRAVLFVTHRLEEALDWADRVSVMRRGRLVATVEADDLGRASSDAREAARARLLRAMFGEPRPVTSLPDAATDSGGQAEPSGSADQSGQADPGGSADEPARGAPIAALELRDVWVASGVGETGLHGVSFLVKSGEILGVAGVEGAGQRELAGVIGGQIRPSRGDVRVAGRSVVSEGVSARQVSGVSHLSGDRLGEGIVATLGVAYNLLLKRIGSPPDWRNGFVRRREIERTCAGALGAFDVSLPSPWVAAGTLSGGTIQKLLLARELLGSPRVMVFENPTAGLDHQTALFVRGLIARMAARDGVAAVVISTDLDEVIELGSRVLVLVGGTVAGEVSGGDGAREAVSSMMVGAA